MPDYSRGKIYKIQCDDGSFYIGSTCSDLRRRLWEHKADHNRGRGYHYLNHISTLGWDRVRIVLVEEFPCENKDQLRRQEDFYIQQHLTDGRCLNTMRSFLTDEERVEKDKIASSNWERANRERRNARRREVYAMRKSKKDDE